MDVGLLAGLLGAFANRDATRVVGGRFAEAEGGELTLVAPGSDFRLYPRIAGSPNRRRVGVHSRSGGARDAVRNRGSRSRRASPSCVSAPANALKLGPCRGLIPNKADAYL
jgi:hypothetical protein